MRPFQHRGVEFDRCGRRFINAKSLRRLRLGLRGENERVARREKKLEGIMVIAVGGEK